MIYKVIKDEQEFEIDDNILFDKQPKGLKNLFNEIKNGDTADFDNSTVLVLHTGRIIITLKSDENGTI
mgnify:CR=1 FL=1